MAEPIRWLVLADPDPDLKGGHGDDARWSIQIAPTPERAVEKWVGDSSWSDRSFVVYNIDDAERRVVKAYSRWEVAHA